MVTAADRALVERGFWAKLRKHATTAGREVVEKALWLYYAARAPQTPAWARSVIYGALAYLVLPADAIPDALPAIGFSDDLVTLTAAVATVALFIDDVLRLRREKAGMGGDQSRVFGLSAVLRRAPVVRNARLEGAVVALGSAVGRDFALLRSRGQRPMKRGLRENASIRHEAAAEHGLEAVASFYKSEVGAAGLRF